MPSRFFIVSVHDVEPNTLEAVERILEEVTRRVGSAFSLAVIPRLPFSDSDRASMTAIIARTEEVLLHGLTHRRDRSLDPFSWLIGRNDEFAGLTREETTAKLREGKRILLETYQVQVAGTLPPAWRGRHVAAALGPADLRFSVMLRALHPLHGRPVRLATMSWDPGPVKLLWPLCEMLGRWPFASKNATPCVAIHPADVRRGLLRRALRQIDRHLDDGRHPTTFQGLLRSLDDAPQAL